MIDSIFKSRANSQKIPQVQSIKGLETIQHPWESGHERQNGRRDPLPRVRRDCQNGGNPRRPRRMPFWHEFRSRSAPRSPSPPTVPFETITARAARPSREPPGIVFPEPPGAAPPPSEIPNPRQRAGPASFGERSRAVPSAPERSGAVDPDGPIAFHPRRRGVVVGCPGRRDRRTEPKRSIRATRGRPDGVSCQGRGDYRIPGRDALDVERLPRAIRFDSKRVEPNHAKENLDTVAPRRRGRPTARLGATGHPRGGISFQDERSDRAAPNRPVPGPRPCPRRNLVTPRF